ncbi:MAG: Smr/MutS family protein, partial [Sphingorhabdus sp.]
MARRLQPDEQALWRRVVDTVKPMHPVVMPAIKMPAPQKTTNLSVRHSREGGGPLPELQASPAGLGKPKAQMMDPRAGSVDRLRLRGGDEDRDGVDTLDSHWDRRFHKGAIIPDVSVDLHGQGLASAHARLDRTLDQAIAQKLRVVLLVTGKARAHDRASGAGRGAIAAVVRDWL